MLVLLRNLGGPDNGKEITISKARYIIGRGEEADFRSQSELISRTHCAIVTDGNQVFVEDLDSSNGTFVNSIRVVGKQSINSGDSLGIGRLLFTLLIDPIRSPSALPAPADGPGSQDTLPPECRTLDADRVLDTFFDRERQ